MLCDTSQKHKKMLNYLLNVILEYLLLFLSHISLKNGWNLPLNLEPPRQPPRDLQLKKSYRAVWEIVMSDSRTNRSIYLDRLSESVEPVLQLNRLKLKLLNTYKLMTVVWTEQIILDYFVLMLWASYETIIY